MADSQIGALMRLLVSDGHMTPEAERQILRALPARDAAVAARTLQDAADAWPVMTRDMVSRGHVRHWIAERARALQSVPEGT